MINIQINNPCHENWDEMSPSEKGRFCSACQKHVIDFTSFSDMEIGEYMTQHTNVCGRFYGYQLEKEYPILPPLKAFLPVSRWNQRFLAASMFLGITAPLAAQVDDCGKITIQGHVLNDSLPIPFSGVFLYEIQLNGTYIEKGYKKLDENALYSFELERDKQYKILADANGFPTNDLFISTNDLPMNDMPEGILIEKDISLGKYQEVYFMGAIAAPYPALTKKKWYMFWKK